MTTKREIDEFLAQKTLAIVGVSRSGKKFGNTILKDLTKLGYRLLPVHPEATEVDGVRAFPSFAALPEPVGGVIVVCAAGPGRERRERSRRPRHPRVWLQQGAGSPEAIRFCQENGMSVVHGECVLMYPKPATSWIHGAHRWVWDLLGRTPK